MLHLFDDGRNQLWRQETFVNDSSVFGQLFHVLALQSRNTWNMQLLTWGKPLLEIMNTEERVASERYVEDLVDLEQV